MATDDNGSTRYDPDPVSVLALIAAIMGAVPGIQTVWSWVNGMSKRSTTGKRDEQLPLDSPFQLGNQLFLSSAQFKRYNEATQDVYRRGAKIEASMHSLLSAFPFAEGEESYGDAAGLRGHPADNLYRHLNRVIGAEQLTIGSAMEAIQAALNESRQMLSALKGEMGN